MKYKAIATCLLLTACGKAPVYVDVLLQPTIDQFQSEIGVSADGVSATFGPLTRPAIALCMVSGNEKHITIDKEYWITMDNMRQQQVMFHELGHCVLMLGHTNDVLGNHCPKSVMYPYAFSDISCYVNNLSYYYHQLKGE